MPSVSPASPQPNPKRTWVRYLIPISQTVIAAMLIEVLRRLLS